MLRDFTWNGIAFEAETGGGLAAAAAAAVPPAAPPAATPPATPAATPPATPAAAATPPVTPAATPPADAAAAAAAIAGKVPAAPYVPKGLDAKLVGKSDQETLDNLAKHLAEQPKPPAAPKDYTLTVPDTLKGMIDPANDKVLPIWRDTAHKLGLTQQQFEGAITELYQGMAKTGLIQPPLDVNAEFAAIGEKAGGDQVTRIQAGQRKVLEISSRFEALATRQEISKADAAELTAMLGSRTAVAAFDKLLALLPAEKGPQGGGEANGFRVDQSLLAKLYPSMAGNARG